MQDIEQILQFEANEERKSLDYLMKWVDSCYEITHRYNWNPDWHKCPICQEHISLDGHITHKPRENLIN